MLPDDSLTTLPPPSALTQPLPLQTDPDSHLQLLLPQRDPKKQPEGRLRYKKLKQRMNLLSDQIIDQGLIKQPRDIASPNKARLMKLALELEKALRTQAIEYPFIESHLKEIAKILEHRREHDLLILRGARMLSTLSAIIRRFPSLHKNQAAQSLPALENSLKMLRTMLTLTSTREALIVGNHMPAVSSMLSCALMRDERKIAVSCLHILNQLLAGTNRVEIHPLLAANAEYILCSSLVKRLRVALQGTVQQDDPSSAEFLLLGFRFYHALLDFACRRDHPRPIYAPCDSPDSLNEAVSAHFQSGLQMLSNCAVQLLMEGEEGEDRTLPRDYELPNFKIGILLYIFKSFNIIFGAGAVSAQLFLPLSPIFLKAALFILQTAKSGFQQTKDSKQLCSQVMVFIGGLAFQNTNNQQCLRAGGILEAICNHPLQYIMDPSLRNVLLPTLCCLVHMNPKNLVSAFAQNSAQPLLNYLQKELALLGQQGEGEEQAFIQSGKHVHCRTLSRKTSVSSINSTYSKASIGQAFSSLPPGQPRLAHRFRPEYWESLAQELRRIDD